MYERKGGRGRWAGQHKDAVSRLDDLRGEGSMYFIVGDYVAGMLVGVLTALGVRAAVWPGMDMVLAMLLGMGTGMIIHLALGLLLAPLLGMFYTMAPAMVIGMYGGMFFGMRDSMAAGSHTLTAAAAVGALFGALVVLGVKVYDRALRGAVIDAGD
jgi:hypothetical protein